LSLVQVTSLVILPATGTKTVLEGTRRVDGSSSSQEVNVKASRAERANNL